jgi:enamine deaminase RidA (YjgF/YER057c/UK114 family)
VRAISEQGVALVGDPGAIARVPVSLYFNRSTAPPRRRSRLCLDQRGIEAFSWRANRRCKQPGMEPEECIEELLRFTRENNVPGGQTGSPDLNFEGQVRQIFSELDKTIKAVGGSGLTDMVTMTVFINDVRLGDRLTDIRREIFKECFPGSALITVSGFARPGILIEIQGIAVVGGK